MKTTKEMIEVMQAYLDGKQIEESIDQKVWFTCEPIWNWAKCDYRVKKKVYVPFDTAEEFLEAQRKHGVYIKRIKDGVLFCSYVYYTGLVLLDDSKGDTYKTQIRDLYGEYMFEDGTPCGKEAEL